MAVDRRQELLGNPAQTLASEKLRREFIEQHVALMKRFKPLRERIQTGEIDPAEIALSVLKEHLRLAEISKSKLSIS